MKEKISRQSAYLILDVFGFLFCIAGIYHLSQKADLPFKVVNQGNVIIISEVPHSLKQHLFSRIVSVDGLSFGKREEIEIYLDSKKIGDAVEILTAGRNSTSTATVSLVPFYSSVYLWIISITGFLFFVVAIFVLLNANDIKAARFYHAVNITTAVIIMTSWGCYFITPSALGIILRIIFHFAYAFAPSIFLHFVFVFPVNREIKHRKQIIILYLISALLFILLNYSFYKILQNINSTTISLYEQGFNLYRLFIIFAVTYGIVITIHNYIRSVSVIEKKKLKWILLGFLAGPGSFILLWVLPQGITGYGFIPEEFVIVLMAAIPVTFGISIYKYHLLDIDLLINRGWVYSIVLAVIFIFYSAFIGAAVRLTGELSSSASLFISVIAAIIVGLIFQPLKDYTQGYVDRYIFKIRYDLKSEHNLLIEEIKTSYTTEILVSRLQERIKGILQANLVDVCIGDYLKKNYDNSFCSSLLEYFRGDNNPEIIPAADMDYVESHLYFIPIGIKHEQYKLIIPAATKASEIVGFIAAGKRTSLLKYNDEEIELLKDAASRAAETFEKIRLQRELILQQAETERLNELNELKSFFVSSVTHDLKTPLTSINLFAEMLQNSDLDEEKRCHYLKIIEGEGNRLSRLVDNVLNYTKIEKRIKEYNYEDLLFEEVVKETLSLLDYQLQIAKVRLLTMYNSKDALIYADRDSVKDTIINLITNAIKYSGANKIISVSTYQSNNSACIDVSDNGNGISEEDLKQIFTPFFRAAETKTKKTSGMGIGLTIVKHVMDAHKGEIKVQSTEGKGSCFTLEFPLSDNATLRDFTAETKNKEF